MKQTERPVWKKSVLQNLTHSDICQYLYEISENGDMYGYDVGETGCELEYKPLFDELSAGANTLLEALTACMPPDCWDDMTVALLGHQQTVLGYDEIYTDYFAMLDPCEENLAIREAEKRLLRMTKQELIHGFRQVITTLVLFWDLKTAHDCLTAIVQELDSRAAMMEGQDGRPEYAPSMWAT